MVEGAPARLLTATGIVAGYGGKQVLSGVDLYVTMGELVGVIGHNGAGKTTLLKSLFGLVSLSSGQVALDFHTWTPNPLSLIRAGIAYVPQGNCVFPALSVRENLQLSTLSVAVEKFVLEDALDDILMTFPALRGRLHQLAGTLSGGERQMLALGRALITKPRLLLLDEPSLGLAPPLVRNVLGLIHDLARDRPMGILVVEQKVREILSVAHRVYVLKRGQVSFQGATEELLQDEEKLRSTYL